MSDPWAPRASGEPEQPGPTERPAQTEPPAQREPPPVHVGGAVVGALLAAALGAAIWALVVNETGYEVGTLAWGVGVLVGFAVLRSGGRGTRGLQALAVLATLVGILAGKYFAFALVAREQLGGGPGLLSGEMRSLFGESLGVVFGLYDLLWVALAVGSAWYILRPQPLAAEAEPSVEPSPASFHSRNPVDRLTRRLPHGLRVTIDWLVTIVGAIAIVLAIKAWVVNPYRIPSSSMEPTLHCARPASGCEARFSDRVLANRFIYHLRSPQRGDIVVFETPRAARIQCGAGGTFVKRLVGLPGETIEVRVRNGASFVFIDGEPLAEPYIERARREASEYPAKKIPPGHFFMMGDNRSQSCDSRRWGTVPRANLIGKVFATYWPPNRLSLR